MWRFLFVLIWLMYMLSSGIHVFSKGFLLSRVALTKVNDCDQMHYCQDAHNKSCLNEMSVYNIFHTGVNETANRLRLPKKSKVILLVIDALKYEFGLYDPGLQSPLPYQNNLPILHKLRLEQPENTRLMKFVADPPTTTLQRLKGITTGSLPTFIDIGSNFATAEINEDNIIDQMLRHNQTAVFMGDSTWTSLFPDRFKRAYPHPSFNINDLDTVDRNISEILPKELDNNDWDLLIAHFLGVDHCGHKYGPLHREMKRKLVEMNRMIEGVIAAMDNDTTLFIVGDHGMTLTGDHGGDSEDELNALLFSYSKQYEFHTDDDESALEMKQIDLVPTLAIILGVPIPFSNLGIINYNLLPNTPVNHLSKSQQFMFHSMLNVHQLHNYQKSITEATPDLFDAEQIAKHVNNFLRTSLSANHAIYPNSQDNFHQNIMKPYIRNIQAEFNDVWVKFDTSQMYQGILFIFLTVFLMYLLIDVVPPLQLTEVFSTNFLIGIYTMNCIIALFGYFFYAEFSFGSRVQSIIVLTSMANVLTIAIKLRANFFFYVHSYIRDGVTAKPSYMARFIFLFTACVFFSNSFIVQEQKVLSYVLIGVMFMLLYNIEKRNMRFMENTKFRLSNVFQSIYVRLTIVTLVAVFCLRVSQLQFRCREEQGNCTEFAAINSFSEVDRRLVNSKMGRGKWSDLQPIILLAFVVVLIRMYLSHMDNFRGYAWNVLLGKFGPGIAIASVGSHFVLSNGNMKHVSRFRIDLMAWVVYFIAALQVILLCIKPLMVRVTDSSSSNKVPEIFREVKAELNKPNGSENERNSRIVRIPWTDGLVGVYSATFISAANIFGLLIALLLGPPASIGLMYVFAVAAAILILGSVYRFQSARTIEKCLHPQFISILAWLLLAHYSFYITSHQPTLSQIEWHSAFIGRQNPEFAHNHYLSAFLVLINTFGAPTLVFLMYPLLCIFGFGMYAKYTSLIPAPYATVKDHMLVHLKLPRNETNHLAERKHLFDLRSGHINLYNRADALHYNAFRVGCWLMLLQGVRIFCSMLACTIHSRHLMVWKIFAPKFMYEGIISYLAFAAIIMGYVMLARIHRAVSSLFRKTALNKEVYNYIDKLNKEKPNVRNILDDMWKQYKIKHGMVDAEQKKDK